MNDLSLTPLVDTALTLLIIFMVATPMLQNSVRVTLPKGSAQDAKGEKEELVVYVDAQNNLFLNSKAFSVAALIDEIKKIAGKGTAKSLFIKADRAATYGTVLELFEKIRSVQGIAHVVLPTAKSA